MPGLRRLSGNSLFDRAWYLETYPEVAATGLDPLAHYRQRGWREGKDPNPLFDSDWYLASYPDVAEDGYEPLDHYLRHGGLEGRDPSPYFDSDWYLAEYPDVGASGMNPLLHYCRFGYWEGRQPRPTITLDQPAPSAGIAQGNLRLRHFAHRMRRPTPNPDSFLATGRPTASTRPEIDIDDLAALRELPVGLVADDAILGVAWATPTLLAEARLKAVTYPDRRANVASALGSSTAAIALLEWQRHNGMTHMALPVGTEAWVASLPAFDAHLRRFRNLTQVEDIRLLDLRRAPAIADARNAEHDLCAFLYRFHDLERHSPAILDLNSGFDFGRAAAGATVFLPPLQEGPPYAYADASVDLVAVAGGDAAAIAEARRIATHAVIVVALDAQSEWRLDFERLGADATSLPSVSIVIPTHNGVDLVRRCLASLDETIPDYVSAEVLVVDDGSNVDAFAALTHICRDLPYVTLLRSESNDGFIKAVGRGARAADGEVLLLLNDDTVALPGWLPALLGTFSQRADAGAVGGRLIAADGTLEQAGQVVFADGTVARIGFGSADPDAPEYSYLHPVDSVSATLLATPLRLFRSIGGFDGAYGFGFGEDADYSFHLRTAGYQTYLQPDSVVVHLGGASAGTHTSAHALRQQHANRELFRSKWPAELRAQPERPARLDEIQASAMADRSGR